MNNHAVFYRFLGIHSLLIGLFPFFIPVYLWNAGFSLASISLFIAISSLTFCCGLRLWEICADKLSLPNLLTLTLLLEILLLLINLGFSRSSEFLLIFAMANGLYNCFFWTTQRVLFVDRVTRDDSGRQYGNFQIFVTVFLKVGIFAGGFLLENFGFAWVFSVSALIVLTAIVYIQTSRISTSIRPDSSDQQYVRWRDCLAFSDSVRSKRIFIVDGLFLFLESHFWTVSLFLLSAQSFITLGLIVIVLALLFALLFYLAKNTIDRLMGAGIYQGAVLLYAISWLLRPWATDSTSLHWLAILLLVITFCSSFFRLVFNKRFYDVANDTRSREYLIIKSYYSQFSAAVMYSFIALLAVVLANDLLTLKMTYIVAGVIALSYLWYRTNYTILAREEE